MTLVEEHVGTRERASNILYRSADVLMLHGWIQGRPSGPDGFCVLGAIGLISGADALEPPTELVSRALRDVIGRGSLIEWNDDPGRTKSEVIQALQEAARRVNPDGT